MPFCTVRGTITGRSGLQFAVAAIIYARLYRSGIAAFRGATMDVRTVCLGLLTRGDATGYEIKKQFEESGYRHFAEASFGSIYPALGRLTVDGLVSVRDEPQEKRPDRKVYSITEAGRTRFLDALMMPLADDRHRSPFAFAMLFSHLLPDTRVRALLDSYIADKESVLARMEAGKSAAKTAGEQFVNGLGRTIYAAIIDYLRAHRVALQPCAREAAE
jgi:DNA-binding PadR family transcriptional regulator